MTYMKLCAIAIFSYNSKKLILDDLRFIFLIQMYEGIKSSN